MWKHVGVMGLAVAVLATGCTPASSRRSAGNTVTVDTTAPERSTLVGDRALDGKVEFQQILTRDVGGILYVQAQVENLQASTLRAQYKVKYYDASGWEMSDPTSSWTPIAFQGSELRALNSKAPSPGATKFAIMLRSDVAAR